MYHSIYTFYEAFIGLFIGIIFAIIFSIIMDMYKIFYDLFYPIILITQTIPTIAIAPLLVLWFGYGIMPKALLVFLTSFFPILISLIEGYKNVDKDYINLFKTFNAKWYQEYIFLKIPFSIPNFLAGLKISITYSLISAVVAEWLGGFRGLGVYMTRVRKSFSLDKMFAIIFFISFLSILLMFLINIIEKKYVYNKKGKYNL